MLIPVSVYKNELVYNLMNELPRKIISILFKGNLPQIHWIRNEWLNPDEIVKAYREPETGMTVLELYNEKVIRILEPIEELMEMLEPYDEDEEDVIFP